MFSLILGIVLVVIGSVVLLQMAFPRFLILPDRTRANWSPITRVVLVVCMVIVVGWGVVQITAASTEAGPQVWCPTQLKLPGALSKATRREPGSFDASRVVGWPETRARGYVIRHGCQWRVVENNGHGRTIILDATGRRVNAAVSNGIVVQVGVW